MSDIVLASIIAAVPPTIVALVGLFVGWRNSRKIDAVHLSTNGKMDKLLEVTGASEKAKGVIEGRADEKASRA